MTCEKCPCPESCLRWRIFCQWAAESPPDPVKIAHIRHRSALGPALRPVAESAELARPTVAESAELARRAAACPYRATGPGCGCSGARCALRAGSVVSHVECFDCLRRYPD